MDVICQSQMPADMRGPLTLPGIAPLDPAVWLHMDDAYDAQMALRDRLVAERRAEVIGACDGSDAAQLEALELVLDHLRGRAGYDVQAGAVMRPDGVSVSLEDAPLDVLGRLAQEDFCILDKRDGAVEHDLIAAALCFPASWRLADKLGRPMIAIHEPVESYGPDLARRVQRMMDGVKAGRPLWRMTKGVGDPTLFQPVSLSRHLPKEVRARMPHIRAERQSLLRLPRTGAVLFSIHTYVVLRETA